MRSWWRAWRSIQPDIRAARRLALILDFDGTMAPIQAHPSRVRLSVRTRRYLRALTQHPRASVALISGRTVRDLKAAVGIPGVHYAGNHGLEYRGPRLRYVHPEARRCRPQLQRIARTLHVTLRGIPGAWVEAKGLTLSVHWRLVPPSRQREFHRLVGQILAPHRRAGAVRLMRGKRVLEVRPPIAWGKGQMIRWWLPRAVGSSHTRPSFVLYIGDDQTDESAFGAVNHLGGASVFVGRPPRHTRARYRLRNPADVRRCLQALWRTVTEADPVARGNARRTS